MPRYIEEGMVYGLFDQSGRASLHVSDIDVLPRADVEVVHGHWTATDVIVHKAGYGVRYYYHAECKVNPHRLFECENDYCPNCGAKMGAKEEGYND